MTMLRDSSELKFPLEPKVMISTVQRCWWESCATANVGVAVEEVRPGVSPRANVSVWVRFANE